MNEFLMLLGNVQNVGWVFLFGLLTLAVTLLIFDRQPKKALKKPLELEDEIPSSQERMAA
jgi:hypothetical protein